MTPPTQLIMDPTATLLPSTLHTTVATWRDSLPPSTLSSHSSLTIIDLHPSPPSTGVSPSSPHSHTPTSSPSPSASSSRSASPNRFHPTLPHAPQLATRGSNFSLPHATLPASLSGGPKFATLPRGRTAGCSGQQGGERAISAPGVERQSGGCGAVGEQKKALAEKMVDTVHDLLLSTWPSACESPSIASCSSSSSDEGEKAKSVGAETESGLVPLKSFIKEILRRSKTSCGTLRCAEWYLMRLRRILVPTSASSTASDLSSHKSLSRDSPLLCPRRAFLAALILAHKFLNDKVYSNRAWAKVSGLEVTEIGRGELALACILEWRLWVGKEDGSEGEVGMGQGWFSDVEIKNKATTSTTVAGAGPARANTLGATQTMPNLTGPPIQSWRDGVRISSGADATNPLPGGLSVSATVPTIMTVSPDGMDTGHGTGCNSVAPSPSFGGSHERGSRMAYRSFAHVRPRTSVSASGSSGFGASQISPNHLGTGSTTLSTCMPGLTLGGSDWEGSGSGGSASGPSPDDWVMVGGVPGHGDVTHEVQIMEGVEEEDETNSNSVVVVQNLQAPIVVANNKKRGSPCGRESAETVIPGWEEGDGVYVKKRKVVMAGEGKGGELIGFVGGCKGCKGASGVVRGQ